MSNRDVDGRSVAWTCLVRTGVVALFVVVLSGILVLLLGGSITYEDNWEKQFYARIEYMLIIAVLIERSVEVYLNATGQNGPDRLKSASDSARGCALRPASIASLVLGLLVAIAGVRIIETVGQLEPSTGVAHDDAGAETQSFFWLTQIIWFGVDAAISGGLLAGGATIFHEVAEGVRGGVRNLSERFKPRKTGEGAWSATSVTTGSAAEKDYTVTVERRGEDNGRLRFEDGEVKVDTTCWWDPNRVISADRYLGCSKTRMATKTDSVTGKKRPAIFLPTAVAPDTGENTIFIHEGSDPSWSDGCIVLKREEMMRMWNTLGPMNGKNITVIVRDV